MLENRPVAGRTGRHLDELLAMLQLDRESISITNAFSQPRWRAEHGRSEATLDEILNPKNLRRLRDEIGRARTIVCCGKKAKRAVQELRLTELNIVCVPHLGLLGLKSIPGNNITDRLDAVAEFIRDHQTRGFHDFFGAVESDDAARPSHPLLPFIGVSANTLLGFFLTFSRLEYAIKHSQNFEDAAEEPRRAHGVLQERWVRFVREVSTTDQEMSRDHRYREAKEFLLDRRVQTEYIDRHGLTWDELPFNDHDEYARLKSVVGTVRNNLFHGGKYRDNRGFDAFTHELLSKVVTILEHWSNHPLVRDEFNVRAA